jgi:hypothetical protein
MNFSKAQLEEYTKAIDIVISTIHNEYKKDEFIVLGNLKLHKDLLIKSLIRLELAVKYIGDEKYHFIIGGELYQSLFSFMQSIIYAYEEEYRIKHIAITKLFNKVCYKNKLLDLNILEKLLECYDVLYMGRINSFYEKTTKIDETTLNDYKLIIDFIYKEIVLWLRQKLLTKKKH